MPEDGGLIGQALIGLKPVNAWVHTYTKPQTSSTRSRGLGRQIHESVEDTKLSTNKQHTLSEDMCYHNQVAITVRRPHRQRMSSAANALLCNIGEGKQCNLLGYFSALQHLCGTRSCGKRARKGHFHGHEHTCTHTGRQSAQPPTLARPESKPATSLTFCAV